MSLTRRFDFELFELREGEIYNIDLLYSFFVLDLMYPRFLMSANPHSSDFFYCRDELLALHNEGTNIFLLF